MMSISRRSVLPLSLTILHSWILDSWRRRRRRRRRKEWNRFLLRFFFTPRHRWWDRPEGEWHDPTGMWNAFGNWRELTRVKEKEDFSKYCVTTCRIRRNDAFILSLEEASEDLIKHLLLSLSLVASRIDDACKKEKEKNRRQFEIRNLWICYFRFEM